MRVRSFLPRTPVPASALVDSVFSSGQRMVSVSSSSPVPPRSSLGLFAFSSCKLAVARLVGIMYLLQSHTLRDPMVNGKGISKVNSSVSGMSPRGKRPGCSCLVSALLMSAGTCHVCWLVVRRQVGRSSSLLPLQLPGTRERCSGS